MGGTVKPRGPAATTDQRSGRATEVDAIEEADGRPKWTSGRRSGRPTEEVYERPKKCTSDRARGQVGAQMLGSPVSSVTLDWN